MQTRKINWQKTPKTKKWNIRWIIIMTMISLIKVSGIAQKGYPVLEQYTSKNSKIKDYVHAVATDKKGYLWIGTNLGAFRFDGYEAKKFPSKNPVTQESTITHFQEDEKGRMWIVGLGGLVSYLENDTFYFFQHSDSLINYCSSRCVTTGFYVENNGDAIYVALNGYGIIKIESNGKHQLLTPPTTPSFLLADFGDKVLRQNYSGGTKKFFSDENRAKQFLPPLYLFKDGKYTLVDTLKNDLFKYSRKAALKLKNGINLVFLHGYLYLLDGTKVLWRKKYPYDLINIFEDKNGELLLSEIRTGVKRFKNLQDLYLGKFQSFLENELVTYSCDDINGGHWFATLRNGLYHSPDIDLKLYNEKSNLPKKNMGRYTIKNDSTLIVQTVDGETFFLIPEKELSKTLGIENANWSYPMNYDQKRERLWMSDPKLFYVENNEKKYIKHFNNDGKEVAIGVRGLAFNRDSSELWASGFSGVTCIDLETKKVKYFSVNHGESTRLTTISIDYQDNIWGSDSRGLLKLENGKFNVIKLNGYPPPLTISAIFYDRDSSLYLGTYGHGVLYYKDSVRWSLTTKHGLSSNNIRGLYLEKSNIFWVLTDFGLDRVERNTDDTYDIIQFTRKSGLPGNNLFRLSKFQGDFWFYSDFGLGRFPLKNPTKNNNKPFIQRVLINNKEQKKIQNLNLSYNKNSIFLKIMYLSYGQKGKINYRYRLEKTDTTWTVSNNPQISLFALAPNSYNFEYQAQDEFGRWSDSSFYQFKINPPFWKTSWFTALWVCALLGLVWFFYRYRINQIQDKVQVEKEINELQRSALRAQMNPHFIFNCLNSIQNFILQNDQTNATKYLGQFAQLTRSTLNASMEEKITLEEEVKMIENYLNLEKLRFKDKMEFAIHVDEQLDWYDTVLPPMLTQPFIENALIHGLGKKNTRGKIEIAYRKQMENLEITIRDNGLGIFQTQKEKAKSDSTRKGVGMSISQKRMELVDGNYDFEVKEIKDDDGKILGTEVRILLEVE